MLNKIGGENSLEILKDNSVIAAMTEREIIKYTNTISPSREHNMIVPVLTVTDAGSMKVPKIKRALRTRESH